MGARRALFVAREPDETLRTYLPVLRLLVGSGRNAPLVLFHHRPGAWAQDELARAGVPWLAVRLPERRLGAWSVPPGVESSRAGATAVEIAQLRATRSLGRELVDRLRPTAVTVIQDTLLLERFLVRAANRAGIPTLVVQWAFTYPQEHYDRFHARDGQSGGGGRTAPIVGRVTAAAYRAALRALDLEFHLANTYGGGEAQWMAVMGEAFAEQFRGQGARKRAIYATGHPSHDASYRLARTWGESDSAEELDRLRVGRHARLITYATQPTLWRKALTPGRLRDMVNTVADGVAALGPEFTLVIKLHPREDAADYEFLRDRPGVLVVKDADVQRLIAASDGFVSSSSSTLLFAMMLDKPIVTVNFDAVPHFDYFAQLGGTLHVRAAADFAPSLAAALRDPAVRARLREEQRQLLVRYTRFDGKAAQRIVDLVEGLASSERG
jgi:hypothetical protein